MAESPWFTGLGALSLPGFPFSPLCRSVCHLATAAAGAYPLRRPTNAWSPGVPAPPGLCYWLVASGNPMGWRGSCLAVGLVRGGVYHYCLGRCSALVVCARNWRLVRGVGAVAGSCVSPVPPSPPPRSPRCVWQVVLSGCLLPWPAGMPFHAVRAFRELGGVALLVFPVCPSRVCALALSRRPRAFPLPGSVWRAHSALFWCRTPVGPFHAIVAPPRLWPRYRALSGLLRGGGRRPRPFPPIPGSGLCAPLWAGLGWGGGAAFVPPPPGAWPGGPEGRGVTLPWSVPLPPLGGHQSSWHRCWSAHGVRCLHTVPVRVRMPTPGGARAVTLFAGAGVPALSRSL